MNLCNSGHDEVCFEGRTCPVCAKTEEAEREAATLQEKIDNLEGTVTQLETELASRGDE